MLTGEAQPAEKTIDDPVYAGTMVLAGTITVRVEKAGADSMAAQIGEILIRTADYRSSLELRGEVIADKSVLPSLALGVTTLAVLGPVSAAAVLVCSFGYQIRYTGPLSVLIYLQIAAKQGVLIKDGRALERVPHVDTIVFDKTGTLTHQQPHVRVIHACSGYTADEILRYAAAAEYRQTHPIARAILDEAAARGIELPAIHAAAYEVGYGISVKIENTTIWVGSARFMQQEGFTVPPDLYAEQRRCHEQGQSLIYVAVGDAIAGAIELHATVRPEVKSIIVGLKQRGLDLYIISGDHKQPTAQLARELGIDKYFAEVLPEDKASLVEQLQREGRSVCFVGDGINDSIALKKAYVSVSLQGATTIAMDTAQVILVNEDLSQLVKLFEIGDELASNMRINFLASTVPAIISVAGIYLLHFGIFAAGMLAWLGMTAGITNVIRPVIKYRHHQSVIPEKKACLEQAHAVDDQPEQGRSVLEAKTV